MTTAYVHAAANLTTENYRCEGSYDLGAPGFRPFFAVYCEDVELPALPVEATLLDASMRSARHMGTLSWSGKYGREMNRCDHCGASFRYGSVLHHLPTDTHIHVGETCLANRFERATADFQRMRHVLRWPEPSLPVTSTGKLLRPRSAPRTSSR